MVRGDTTVEAQLLTESVQQNYAILVVEEGLENKGTPASRALTSDGVIFIVIINAMTNSQRIFFILLFINRFHVPLLHK